MDLLVIDDVTDTGETLSTAVRYLNQLRPARIRTGVLHHTLSSGFTPDYYTELVSDWHWIIYPWAMHEDRSGFLEVERTKKPISLSHLREIVRKRKNADITQGSFKCSERSGPDAQGSEVWRFLSET
jgi:uncharacterized protein